MSFQVLFFTNYSCKSVEVNWHLFFHQYKPCLLEIIDTDDRSQTGNINTNIYQIIYNHSPLTFVPGPLTFLINAIECVKNMQIACESTTNVGNIIESTHLTRSELVARLRMWQTGHLILHDLQILLICREYRQS